MKPKPRSAKRYVVISLHPKFADAIVAGTKTVEIRRRVMRLHPGDVVLVYATAPRMEFVGTARVSGTVSDTPPRLWTRTAELTGVDARSYRDYLRGAPLAHGICLERATKFARDVTLDRARAILSGFHPPRGHMFVPRRSAMRIMAAGASVKRKKTKPSRGKAQTTVRREHPD